MKRAKPESSSVPAGACEVEACMRSTCTASREAVQQAVVAEVVAQASGRGGTLVGGSALALGNVTPLCSALRVCESPAGRALTVSAEAPPRVYVYSLVDQSRIDEAAEDDSGLVTFSQWTLPCAEFEGVWESLVFDDDLKPALLHYAESAMIFADAGIDANIISCNRVVLLHGPPGVGKTTILKGLAQKIAIRLGSRFDAGQFVEINAHSLFSKWFSESGKLVTKMFNKITEIVEDRSLFVCVLIDEVESLTAARQAAANGTEPSDAIRVVNALLTQLDRLKLHPNVLVMTTSNLTKAIDEAFVDRADVCRYVGNPGAGARYRILASCVEEMMRAGLIAPRKSLLSHESASLSVVEGAEDSVEALLLKCARLADGFSGRRLRKLPLLAFAMGRGSGQPTVAPVATLDYLRVLIAAITSHAAQAIHNQ